MFCVLNMVIRAAEMQPDMKAIGFAKVLLLELKYHHFDKKSLVTLEVDNFEN